MKQDDYCKKSCPYLKRLSEKGKLPFYCDLYRSFLATKKHHIIRTDACLGKSLDTQESGYQFISSYQNKAISKQMTKWGFHRLNPQIQAQFVQLIHQEGNEIGVLNNTPFKDKLIVSTLVGQIKMIHAELNVSEENATNKFSQLIDKLEEDFPILLNDGNKNLLQNLFSMLDKSEQGLLMGILSTPQKAESFLKTFDEMPKGENLLKDLRRELFEIENEKEEELKSLQQNDWLRFQLRLKNNSR